MADVRPVVFAASCHFIELVILLTVFNVTDFSVNFHTLFNGAERMATASAACSLPSLADDLSTCLPKVRVPALGDNVHKEECCLSFDTPVGVGS